MNKLSIFIIVWLFTLTPVSGQIESVSMPVLAKCAETLTKDVVIYDPSYYKIKYPMGDVPADRGVCTDVIIRAYRKVDIDLQQLVHEDMKGNFDQYPQRWGLKSTDTNIDHRRVPNLMAFFRRMGGEKKITGNPKDYQPGDIVCWDLGGGVLHIGMISSVKSKEDPARYMIVHNIGGGQVSEDRLFEWKIIGHYRYMRKNQV